MVCVCGNVCVVDPFCSPHGVHHLLYRLCLQVQEPTPETTEEPEVEETEAADEEQGSKQNRNEKKSRKALQKLGMKPVPGVC